MSVESLRTSRMPWHAKAIASFFHNMSRFLRMIFVLSMGETENGLPRLVPLTTVFKLRMTPHRLKKDKSWIRTITVGILLAMSFLGFPVGSISYIQFMAAFFPVTGRSAFCKACFSSATFLGGFSRTWNSFGWTDRVRHSVSPWPNRIHQRGFNPWSLGANSELLDWPDSCGKKSLCWNLAWNQSTIGLDLTRTLHLDFGSKHPNLP